MFVTMSDVFDGNVYVGSDKHTSNVNRAILVAEIECSEQGWAEPRLLSKKAGTLPGDSSRVPASFEMKSDEIGISSRVPACFAAFRAASKDSFKFREIPANSMKF